MKKNPAETKVKLHPRNKNNKVYDLKALAREHPPLASYIIIGKHGLPTIKFSNPKAVLELNKALLISHYNISGWSVPEGYLCPPIPGRADYMHHIADILSTANNNKVPKGSHINAFDLGVGANCVYPLIGQTEYNWSFVATDFDKVALKNAKTILKKNPHVEPSISLRQQPNREHFFKSVVKENEYFDVMVCNPPFYSNTEEANQASRRKITKLSKGKITGNSKRNFAGQKHELCYQGGESTFISKLIKESKIYAKQFYIFSTLVSQSKHLPKLLQQLESADVALKTVTPMAQGQKSSRILSWSFLNEKQRGIWVKARWLG